MDLDKLPENLKDALCKAEKRFCEYYCKYEPETNNIIIAIRHNITHTSINLKIPTHMLFNFHTYLLYPNYKLLVKYFKTYY